jgi:NAD(P)-dependent dehydrogenase (short-subunit alcohol dehydrogenase family)
MVLGKRVELKGKVAVVCGGARGLGFSVARSLATRGAKVALAARTLADAQVAAEGLTGEVKPYGCDVRDAAQFDALLAAATKELGPIDVWVNAVGPSGPFGPARELSIADQREPLEATVQGTWLGTMAALKTMAARTEGCIVNVLGRTEPEPRPTNAAFDANKAWVRSFTLSLADEQKDTGLRFIAFEPGLMETRSALMPEVTAGLEDQLKARLGLLRTKGMPPEVPAERLVDAIESGARGLVKGTPPLWALRGPLRMLFGGRPDFVISPKVLPRR